MKIKEIISIRDGALPEYSFITGQDCIDELNGILEPILIMSDKQELLEEYDKKYKFNVDSKLFSKEKIAEISNTKSFTGICVIGKIKKTKMPLTGLFIVLDGIQDPGNLGNIFRNGASHNVAGIILSDNCCHINKQKTIRSSRGFCFKLPSIRVNRALLYNSFKPENTWLSLKTDTDFKNSCKEISKLRTSFIVFGNEGKGISYNWHPECKRLWIPCLIESLNVGSATSIVINRIKLP